MTDFATAMERVKNGTASEDERRLVQQELVKFELLMEYSDQALNALLGLNGAGEVPGAEGAETRPGAQDGARGRAKAPGGNAQKPPEEPNAAIAPVPGTTTQGTSGTAPASGATASGAGASIDALIRQGMRRTLGRMGLAVTALVLVLVLFCSLALSPVLDAIFYNPSRNFIPAYTVFSRLMGPFSSANNLYLQPRGFGNYDVYASQNGQTQFTHFPDGLFFDRLPSDAMNSYKLSIERGRLSVTEGNGPGYRYGYGMYTGGNSVFWVGANLVSRVLLPVNKQLAAQLPAGEVYTLYAEFSTPQDFAAITHIDQSLCNQQLRSNPSLWFGTYSVDFSGMPMGFSLNSLVPSFLHYVGRADDHSPDPDGHNPVTATFQLMGYETANYPHLFDESLNTRRRDEAFVTQHFLTMLRYLQNQRDFLSVMGYSSHQELLQAAQQQVEENGLTANVCALYGTREDALTLLGLPGIKTVYALPGEQVPLAPSALLPE